MLNFFFDARIPRTIFGFGTVQDIPGEVERLGVRHVLLIIESKSRWLTLAERVKESLGNKVVGICSEAVMHTPEDVTLKALKQAEEAKSDCLISLGGGSTIGLGKALSIRMSIPHIAVPTTYAGSEATPILGETVNNVKTTRSDPKILPTTIIYDVNLTLSLPQQLTNTSGINAIAHCVEALYSTQLNPIVEGVALTGITSIFSALRTLKDEPNDVEARSQALSGAWAAGVCLGHVGMGIHHKLCHTLGGTLKLPHSEVHTVILPHAMAYNADAAVSAMAKIHRATAATGDVSAARAMWDLEKELGTVTSLRQLGMKREDLGKAVELAMKTQYPNPAKLEEDRLLELLTNAFDGKPPK